MGLDPHDGQWLFSALLPVLHIFLERGVACEGQKSLLVSFEFPRIEFDRPHILLSLLRPNAPRKPRAKAGAMQET